MTLPIIVRRGTMILIGIYILEMLLRIHSSTSHIWDMLSPWHKVQGCYAPLLLSLVGVVAIITSRPFSPHVACALPAYLGLMRLQDLIFQFSRDSTVNFATVIRLLMWILVVLLVFHIIRIEQLIGKNRP